MSRNYREQIRNFSLGMAVETRLLSDLFLSSINNRDESDSEDAIAIVGGELFNKGAQAMTFTIVDEISKRHPQKDIYLLSGRDYKRSQEEKERYAFEILPWGPEIVLPLLSRTLSIINTREFPKTDVERVWDVLPECEYIIDIHGYALSSQQGFDDSVSFLMNVVLARKLDIPIYVFPQSIGPFDYSTGKKLALNPLLQTYLSYPEIVCPREAAGVEDLYPYTKNNVQREFDIVLQHGDYDLNNIYRCTSDIQHIKVEPKAVGIVPNSKVFERADPEHLYSVYQSTIKTLLSEGRPVYVFQHSVEDLQLCKNIKKLFADEKRVVLLDDELNAIELEYVISQLDFLIGSRYHSIIHAYKNHVPVIAIGWAVKYEELLDEFDQSMYFFDGRDEIDTTQFLSAVQKLSDHYKHESEIIGSKRKEIQRNNLFERSFNK